MNGKRYTVAVDLDGVLNVYAGWTGDERDYAPPRPGAREFMAALMERWRVEVFTTRDVPATTRWLREHDIPFSVVSSIKPKALVYLDDRAMLFEGSFDGLVERIAAFRPHWQES